MIKLEEDWEVVKPEEPEVPTATATAVPNVPSDWEVVSPPTLNNADGVTIPGSQPGETNSVFVPEKNVTVGYPAAWSAEQAAPLVHKSVFGFPITPPSYIIGPSLATRPTKGITTGTEGQEGQETPKSGLEQATKDLIYWPTRLFSAGVEKPAWAITRLMLESADGYYKLGMFLADDQRLAEELQGQNPGFLSRAVEYYSHPEEHAALTKWAETERYKRDQANIQRNYLWALAGRGAETVTDLTAFFLPFMAEDKFAQAMKGGEMLVSASELEKMHIIGNVSRMSKYGFLTTNGDLSERFKSGLFLAAYGLTGPLANATGAVGINAVAVNTALNTMLNVPTYKQAFDESGGNLPGFFLMAIPQFMTDFAFSYHTRGTPENQYIKYLENFWTGRAKEFKIPKEDYQKYIGSIRDIVKNPKSYEPISNAELSQMLADHETIYRSPEADTLYRRSDKRPPEFGGAYHIGINGEIISVETEHYQNQLDNYKAFGYDKATADRLRVIGDKLESEQTVSKKDMDWYTKEMRRPFKEGALRIITDGANLGIDGEKYTPEVIDKVLKLIDEKGLQPDEITLDFPNMQARIGTGQFLSGKFKNGEFDNFTQGERYFRVTPTFFSYLNRVVESKVPTNASAEQILSTIRNSGVRKEEMEWMGIETFLKEQGGKVDKGLLQDYIAAHEVKLKEVLKQFKVSNKGPITSYLELPAVITRSSEFQVVHEIDEQVTPHFAKSDIMDQIREVLGDKDAKKIQVSDVLLNEDQSREAYFQANIRGPKELLKKLADEDMIPDLLGSNEQTTDTTKFKDYQTRGQMGNYSELLLTIPRNKYTSSHWDEPGVVVHVRFNEANDGQGNRILYIEEIQSDLHAQGRAGGYRKPGEKVQYFLKPGTEVKKISVGDIDMDGGTVEVGDTRIGMWAMYADGEMLPNNPLSPKFSYEKALGLLSDGTIDALGAEADRYVTSTVPDAPFKKTWHELALKRVLRYAAENGYDKVAWTPAEKQFERYPGTHKVYDQLQYERRDDGTYEIRAREKGSRILSHLTFEQPVTPENLSSLIGPELANKVLLDQGTQVHPYSKLRKGFNQDFSVGGELHKLLYDKWIPEFLEKFGKPFGVTVGETRVENMYQNYTSRSMDITPEMKSSIMQGLPLFRAPGEGRDMSTYAAESAKLQALLDKHGIEKIAMAMVDYIQGPGGKGAEGAYLTKEQLVKMIEKPLTGTAYHEGFHILARHSASAETIESAIQEVMKLGSYERLKAEEHLAELFSNYAEKKNITDKSFGPKSKALFDKVMGFIQQKGPNLVDQMFNELLDPTEKAKAMEMAPDRGEAATALEMGAAGELPEGGNILGAEGVTPLVTEMKPIEPVTGGGETKTRGLALGVEEKALKNDLTKGFKDLPEYDVVNMEDQFNKAMNFMSADKSLAEKVALGLEPAPKDILPEMVFKVVEDQAIRDQNIDLIHRLATESALVEEATTMGQRIRALGERDPDSPVAAMKDVMREREKAVAERMKKKDVREAKQSVVKEIEKSIQENLPPKDAWIKFVEGLKC